MEKASQNDWDQALARAARDGDAEAALLALQAGASPKATLRAGERDMQRGWPALMLAARGPFYKLGENWPGRERALLALLEAGESGAFMHEIEGGPLHQAAYSKAPASVIEALAAAGALIDAPTRDGQTALSLAAETGAAGAIGALLRLGASPASRDNMGRSPEDWAEKTGYKAVFLSELLKFEREALELAAHSGAHTARFRI